MISNVLDSSAVLAVINQEKGADKALTFFPDAIVSSVNLTEILTKIKVTQLNAQTGC
jgi:PIN domain nuclease of toxin-antitoxin system